MSTKQTLITSRDPKGRQATSIFEAAYNDAKLDEERAQRLNERGGELKGGILRIITELSTPNQYANEEVKSNYGYRSGYRQPVKVPDQIDILRSHWPQLNPDGAMRYMREVWPTLQLPSWVEGPFALMRPGFFSDIYGEEIEEVFNALKKDLKGKFVNYREGQLGPEYLRQSEQTLSKLRILMEQQPGSDILIALVQLGIHHRGRSVRRAREVFDASEYGEGAKNVGTMLLTNPTRLQHYDDLWLDCAGDEYAPDAGGEFDGAPCFHFYGGGVRFVTYWVGYAHDRCGSVSAFLP